MQVPVQIDFRGNAPKERMREQIVAKLGDLEQAFGRIVAARVVITAPSERHKSGGHFEIGVHLTLPGGHLVDVERTPDPDERFADPAFAIGDVFRRARRQLQDEARRLDGRVKQHEPSPAGKVVHLDLERGFGRLLADDGADIYFHRNSVLDGKFKQLSVGSRVAFAEEEGENGPQASTVRVLGGST
jgi:cold shock CspA family protein